MRAQVAGVIVIGASEALFLLQMLILLRQTATAINLTLSIAGIVLAFAIMLYAIVDAARRSWAMPHRPAVSWLKSTWLIAIICFGINGTISATLPTPSDPTSIAAANWFPWHPYYIPSGSNVPNIVVGDYILTKQLPPNTSPPRGTIIVFHPPGEPSNSYIKRVIGLPGDTVQLTGGQLYINGIEIPRTDLGPFTDASSGTPIICEEYLETLPGGRTEKIIKATDDGFANNTPVFTVPAGDVFLLGDNRDNSEDSRFMDGPVGYVPIANITGEVTTIFWPPHRFQQLK